MLKKRLTIRSSILWWGAIGTVAFLFLAVVGDQGLLRLYELKQIEKSIVKKISGLENENQTMTREINSLQSPSYLEKVARQELGFLHPKEVIYYINPLSE
jgi:cell division protein FtsB